MNWKRCGIFAAGWILGVVLCVASELPSLEKAREVGRAKSAFLSDGKAAHQNEKAQSAALAEFKEHIAPILQKTCVECHGPKKAKAKFRVDTLDPDLLNGGDVDWWLEVLDVLSNGEMPPEDADIHLSKGDLGKMVEWLNGEIQKASTARRNEGGQNSVPGILNWMELDDVTALIAPRPLLAVSGVRDHIWPFAGCEAVIDAAKPAWRELRASHEPVCSAAPGEHRFHPEATWPLLRKMRTRAVGGSD